MATDNRQRVLFMPILLIFIFVTAFAILFRSRLEQWGVSQPVLIGGNLLIFAITAISFVMHSRALKANNTQAFVRNVYGGLMMKFFVCIIAALAYAFIQRKNINKPALFIVMFLYLVYMFTEVGILTKKRKGQNNA